MLSNPRSLRAPTRATVLSILALGLLFRLSGSGLAVDRFIRGDANGDATVDISDPLHTLGCLFLGTKCSECEDAADANDDGTVDLGDPVRVLNHLFLSGPAPAAPFPDCGTDPTEDRLGCRSFRNCAAGDPEEVVEGEGGGDPLREDGEGEEPRGDTTIDETPSKSGLLEMHATNESDAFSTLVVQIESIELQHESGEWHSYLGDVTELTLDAANPGALGEGLAERMPPAKLPAGAYRGVRVALGSMQTFVAGELSEFDAGDIDTNLPAGAAVVPSQTTVIVMGFHANAAGQIRLVFSLGRVEPRPEIDPLQVAVLERLRSASSADVEVRFDPATGVPEVLTGGWSVDTGNLSRGIESFLTTYAPLFRLQTLDSFEAMTSRDTRLGKTVVRMQQYHGGVQVESADVIAHVRDGELVFLHGNLVPDLDVSTTPRVASEDALVSVRRDLASRFRGIGIDDFSRPRLVIFSPALFDAAGRDARNRLTWKVVTQTLSPAGQWHHYVDAMSGDVVWARDLAEGIVPVDTYDALNTETTSDDVKWYEDDDKIEEGTAPDEVKSLRLFSHNFHLYLKVKFGIDSIDDGDMKMIGRANDPAADGKNACWDCRSDQTIYLSGWVTSDVVGHEFGHGVVEKMGGGLKTGVQARTLNEFHADALAELFDCWMEDSCAWLVGTDKWGNSVPSGPGYVRDMSNPSVDHMSDYDWDTSSPYKNIGIPSKVIQLLVDGGTHHGISVGAIGKTKTEQLLYSSLVDSGLSSSASFDEYRAVMIRTCREMIGGEFGVTSWDCRQVYRAWSSVGLGALIQPVVGALSETSDYFGYSLASGDFNGDSYKDLAVGTPYEDYSGAVDTGVIFVFFGSSFGLKASGAETIAQSHIGGGANGQGDRFGWSLAAGNFSGDSYDDLAIGVPYKDLSGKWAVGMVKVIYGRSWGFKKNGEVSAWEGFHQGFANGALETGDRFGWSLATGDFNGNGHDDLAVGVPFEDIGNIDDSGLVNIFYGSSQGLIRNNGNMSWEGFTQSLIGAANEAHDRFGYTLAAGNFNGGSYDDLAIGVPYEHLGSTADCGVVNIVYGSSQGIIRSGPSISWERLNQSYANASVESGDRFAFSLAAGNFDGDAYDDLALGAPGEDFDGLQNAGNLTIFYGSGAGIYPVTWERLDQSIAGSIPESHDEFARTLSSGNLNGDAYDELIIGVPHENFGSTKDVGMTMVLWGSANGVLPASWQWFSQSLVGGENEAHDRFGWAMATGDFDGNGDDDIAVSAPWENFPNGSVNAGAVYIREY